MPPWYRNISKRLIKSPKIYFCDVGLASYLLGLENERHVSRDPLRNNLFENLVVMEALKYRYHRGRKSNLGFYFPIEIKAGETITPDYFQSLKHFRKIMTDLPWGAGLIYGGRERQLRSDTRIYPVYDLADMLNEIKDNSA